MTMRKMMIAAGAATLILTGCGKSGPPPKREPGSWSQKVELKRSEGKDAERKAATEQAFATMNSISICVTPEMAAKEDPAADLGKLGGSSGNCTFDRKSIAGGDLDIAGTCKGAGGKTSKVTASGKLGATAQDMDITVEVLDATGAREGLSEMLVHSVRNGECTAKDMKAPTATM